jgi:hypothetical protein
MLKSPFWSPWNHILKKNVVEIQIVDEIFFEHGRLRKSFVLVVDGFVPSPE